MGKITTDFTATSFNLKSQYIQDVNELDEMVLKSGEESLNSENHLNTTVDSHIGNDFNSVNGGVGLH